MKCCKCGADINQLNHYYVPCGTGSEGKRYCIRCAREERIITLV